MSMVQLHAIMPKHPNFVQADHKIEGYMRKVNDEMATDFERTQSTWTHKADFEKKVGYESFSVFTASVSTISNVYRWVSGGTKKHWIEPTAEYEKGETTQGPWNPRSGRPAPMTRMTKKRKLLRWQSGYTHKTSVGSLTSGPGGHFGPWDSASPGHFVSGIEARMYDALLVEQKWAEKFVSGAKAVMEDISNSSGHKAK